MLRETTKCLLTRFSYIQVDIGVHTAQLWHKTDPICDALLSISARRSLIYFATEIALPKPFLCEQTPCDFRVGAKAVQFSVNKAYSPTASCGI